MITQSVFKFKLETTKERLTAHSGLAILAEFSHGLGIKNLIDQHMPAPGSKHRILTFKNGQPNWEGKDIEKDVAIPD